jgi:hypothetical protein
MVHGPLDLDPPLAHAQTLPTRPTPVNHIEPVTMYQDGKKPPQLALRG